MKLTLNVSRVYSDKMAASSVSTQRQINSDSTAESKKKNMELEDTDSLEI